MIKLKVGDHIKYTVLPGPTAGVDEGKSFECRVDRIYPKLPWPVVGFEGGLITCLEEIVEVNGVAVQPGEVEL